MSELLKQHIRSITDITDEEFELLQPHFRRKHFRKHQLLVQEGNTVQYYYFLESGLTKSFYIDEKGKEYIVGFAMNEYWVTDMEALFNRTPASINIQSLENSAALGISYANMEKLCDQLPKVQYFFRMKMMAENAALQRRTLCLIKNNAADRYHDLLANHPELVGRLSKSLIAAFLGISRETLSRMTIKV